MNEDFLELDSIYENLLRESTKLDIAIEEAFDELQSVFANHYPILKEVSILEFSVEELTTWIQTRLRNSEQ